MGNKIYSKEVEKILDDYFEQLKSEIKMLPRLERQEILDEIQSDILAELRQERKEDSESQIKFLFSILEKLGKPEEVADEILSKRVVSFQGNFLKRFFILTGRNLLEALAGLIVSFLSLILYFIGLLNLAMAGLKVFMPEKIGLFMSEKGFCGYGFKLGSFDIAVGSITGVRGHEILGYWVIPIGILAGLILIFCTNFLNIKARKILR